MRSRLKQFLFHVSLLSHRPPSPPCTPDQELEKRIWMHWPRQLYSNGGYTGQGDFTGTVDHWLRGLHSDGVVDHWLRGLHSNGGYTGQGDFTVTVDTLAKATLQERWITG